MAKDLVVSKKSSTFALAYQKWQQITLQGVLTERLGNGLQNRVERFDSARHLKKEILVKGSLFCFYTPSLLFSITNPHSLNTSFLIGKNTKDKGEIVILH